MQIREGMTPQVIQQPTFSGTSIVQKNGETLHVTQTSNVGNLWDLAKAHPSMTSKQEISLK